MKHLYSALLCIVVRPKRFTIMCRGVSPQPPTVCSIHLDDATAATGQRHQCAHNTPATGGEGERVIEPVKCNALTTHQLQVEKRESHRANQVYVLTTHQLQVMRRESHRANQVYGLTTLQVERRERVVEPIKWMRSPHTSYRWRGERVIETIKCLGIIRRPWLIRASGGNLARTPGLHPYSLREVPWDF